MQALPGSDPSVEDFRLMDNSTRGQYKVATFLIPACIRKSMTITALIGVSGINRLDLAQSNLFIYTAEFS